MTNKLIKATLLTALLVTNYYLLPNTLIPKVNAISAGLGVSKSVADFEIPAGTTHSDKITVLNNSTSTALPVHIDLLLWNLKEDSDDIEFIRAEEGLNATKWFDIDTVDFILEPGATRKINYTIGPPRNVSPGSYFVMMRFQPTFPEFYFEEEGPRFIPEVGSLFFLKVPFLSLDGEANAYSAEIVSLEPGGSQKIGLINNFLPEANAGVFDGAVKVLIAEIANNGIFHFKASGNIKVKNIFGRTVAEAELPGKFLLPNRTRPIETIILPAPTTEDLPFLSRTFKSITYNLKTNTYFGPYSAIITLSIPGNTPVVESVNFWVVPWQFWLIVGVISAGLVLIFRRGRGRFTLALKVLIERKIIKKDDSIT